MSEKVAILGGTGSLGFGLAVRLGGAGCEVIIGSRDESRAVEGAERAQNLVPQGHFSGAVNREAVVGARVVILCVPFANQIRILKEVRKGLRAGTILLDTTVPKSEAKRS